MGSLQRLHVRGMQDDAGSSCFSFAEVSMTFMHITVGISGGNKGAAFVPERKQLFL